MTFVAVIFGAVLGSVTATVSRPAGAASRNSVVQAQLDSGEPQETTVNRVVIVPDTNFFLDCPDFISFLRPSRCLVHVAVLWPVLCELDVHRKARNHADPRRQGLAKRAATAIEAITRLQRTQIDGIQYELFRPDPGLPSGHPDALIIDHAVKLAADHMPNDEIIFITDDKGLPTVLFFEETKQRGLKHIRILSSRDFELTLPSLGVPTAKFENVSLVYKPRAPSAVRGVELLLTCTVVGFRHGIIQAAVNFRNQEDHSWKSVAAQFKATSVDHRESDIRLPIPFDLLGAKPSRHGMHHVWLALTLRDASHQVVIEKNDQHFLNLALGSCFLSKG